jgi:type I restriction enzyme S subunit
MSTLIAQAASELAKRESPVLVAGAGLLFKKLSETAQSSTLEQVLESHRGGVWGDEAAPGYGYPVLRSTNMRSTKADIRNVAWRQVPDGVAARYALKTGDILVTKSSGSADLVGKAVLFSHPGDDRTYLFSNFTLRLRPALSRIEPRYLAWFLRSPQALLWRFEAQQNAVGLRNLSTSAYLDQQVPVPDLGMQRTIADYLDSLEIKEVGEVELPSALAEQQRIVARIEELGAKIEETRGLRRQAVEQAEVLIPNTIQVLFTNGAHNGWPPAQLGDYVADDCYGTSEKTYDDQTGTPILRMGNIQNGQFDLSDLKFLNLSEKERSRLLLQKGDILVNRTNSAELVGKCAVFEAKGEYAFASYLIRLRLDQKRAEPRLVAAYINSPIGRSYMFAERKQMTGQANVNATKLKALPIHLPGLTEQRRIVAYLDDLQAKVNALKKLQAETAAELDALLPSILDKAFKGEL